MPTITQRLRDFASSPRGKRLIEQGQQQLAKPENKQKAKQLLDKLRSRRAQSR